MTEVLACLAFITLGVCLIQEDEDIEVTSGSPLPGVKVIMMLYHFLDWNLQERSSFPASSFTSSHVS